MCDRCVLTLLFVLLLVGGCAHSTTLGTVPPPAASNDEREQFYQDHRIANPRGEQAERCLFYAVDCACDHPCVNYDLYDNTRLGNGQEVTDIRVLAPLVGDTGAGGALATYALARSLGPWAGIVGSLSITTVLAFLVFPPLTDAVLLVARPSDPTLFLVATLGSCFAVGAVALLGAAVARVVELISRESFFELYNPSLRERLGLPKEEPDPVAAAARRQGGPRRLVRAEPQRATQLRPGPLAY